MLGKSYFQSMVAGATLFLLVGCGGSSEQSAGGSCDDAGYVEASRAFGAREGERIRERASPYLSQDNTAREAFGKLYNPEWLAAVAKTSIAQTLQFIQKTGVRVFRTEPLSLGSAQPLSLLPSPPEDLGKKWKQVTIPNPLEPCEFVIGYYLHQGSDGLPSLKGQSAIMLRADANRWKLVHEFMHHNFRTHAVNFSGYDDQSLKNREREISVKIYALDQEYPDSRKQNKKYTQVKVPLFLEWVKIWDELMVQYLFEEILIEVMLQKMYMRGELEFVPKVQFEKSLARNAVARKGIRAMYGNMDYHYYQLRSLASTNGLWREHRLLAGYLETRDARLAELEALLHSKQ